MHSPNLTAQLPNLTAQLTLTQDTDCLLEQMVCLLHSSLLSQLQPCPLLRATFGSDSASKHVWKLVVTGNLWRTLVSERWTRWCLQLRPLPHSGASGCSTRPFRMGHLPLTIWHRMLGQQPCHETCHSGKTQNWGSYCKVPVCLYCQYLWWKPPWDGGDEPTVREIIIKAWGRECPSKHSYSQVCSKECWSCNWGECKGNSKYCSIHAS